MKSFSIRIKPEDILKLDEILKPCVELTTLSLSLTLLLCTSHRNDTLRQSLANHVSLLLSHHPTVKNVVFCGFEDLIVGYWDKYRLPTSIETLAVFDSVLMHVDLDHSTDVSTTSRIRHILIASLTYSICPSGVEGYLKFIESHAETLVTLNIHLSWNEHQATVNGLKRMAKRLAQFNKLQSFTYYVRNVDDILVILREVMPSIAINQSLNSYSISSNRCFLGYDRDFLQSLRLAMKTACVGRERLLDYAMIISEHHQGSNGIPIVEYEDLWEVVGYQCCSRDGDYDCEQDTDDEYVEDGIPIGRPIGCTYSGRKEGRRVKSSGRLRRVNGRPPRYGRER